MNTDKIFRFLLSVFIRVHLWPLIPFAAACWAQTAVTIAAHPESPGIAIARDFIGLSFETGSIASATGFPAENPVLQRMVAQVGPGLLRFGGNSVDTLTGWMRGQRTPSTPSSVITSSDADRVFAFARTVGWRVLFSLNLGHGDPATDADEADYVYGSASDVLSGFEIGNEPDLYHSNGLRPTTYTVNDYMAEWQTYADAIQTKVPAAVLTGSAAAGSITTWTSIFASQLGSRIALLTQHLYPLAPTSAVSSTASNVASIPHILGATARQTEDTDGSELQQIAQGQKIPWRMAETNSCYNGGETGVSNVFASALWGVDYMFTLAGRNSAGVNFHGGGTGTYTPIAVTTTQATARPLYYALLLFRAAARGRVVPVTVSTNGVNLTAYGALDDDGTLRLTVINKDTTQDAAVSMAPGSGYTTALAMRLAAPAVDSTTGVTLGGSSVQADGSWLPAQLENISSSGGAFLTTVPAASAVLVNFGNGNMAVANAAGGQREIAPNSLASAYGQPLGMVESTSPSGTPVAGLAGVVATMTDAAGATRPLALTYAGPSQVNFLVPDGTATGTATVHIGAVSGTVTVSAVAPGLFSMGASTTAAAGAIRVPNGQTTQTVLPVFDCSSGACNTVPIVIDNQSTVYVSLYGTGLRGAAASSVTCTVGGVQAPVTYAGPQGPFAGLDQVNISIPAALRGRGEVDVVVTAGGKASNAVRLGFGG
jgi:uncharacterized protein (TIGR03437 family)